MNITLERIIIHTKKSRETIDFSELITFVYGPVGKGKSTLARLVDFCFGGSLENTPAIQQEFISAILYLRIGNYKCTLERSATDKSCVRISWFESDKVNSSVNAPLQTQSEPIIPDSELYTLSDIIYFLCGIEPIKVRQRNSDADSPMIRLSFRDLWHYCYLEQMHLDSSFFRFEDPFRGRKSQDAMRFFTGLHSERFSQLETDLMKVIDEQRAKRGAVKQIRDFMGQFELGTEDEIIIQLQETKDTLSEVKLKNDELHKKRNIDIHPTDTLREKILSLSKQIYQFKIVIDDSIEILNEQRMLHSELITAKIKNDRLVQASMLFTDVKFQSCPACGVKINLTENIDCCSLCGKKASEYKLGDKIDNESLRKDLNVRIDELADSIKRREMEISKTEKQLNKFIIKKVYLDVQLQNDLHNYDSAIIEEIRYVDKMIATLEERVSSLEKLKSMPQAINKLEEDAGALQGKIDSLRTKFEYERKRLSEADIIVNMIANEFKRLMISVNFPGVYQDDQVIIDPRNWKPEVIHGDTSWSFWDTGSGGKKTLFNVCYALAIHTIASKRNLPVPSLLIIDSPTKNISDDENPELINSLYNEIYRLAFENKGNLQFILIDSNFVAPTIELPGFILRHMAGTKEDPSLISYYDGP